MRRLFALVCLLAGMLAPVRAADDPYPRAASLTSLTVLPAGSFGTAAEQVMAATLQGLVARQSGDQIYLEGGGGYSLWKNHLHDAYKIPWTTAGSPWALLRQFRGMADGYVLYDAGALPDSLNAATSLAGMLRAVAADVSIEARVRAAGLTNRLFDARGATASTVWSNAVGRFNRRVVIEQRATIAAHLRDYAVMAGAFAFFDGNSPFRSRVMAGMATDAACLGWGDAGQGESVFVGDGSRHGVHTVAADWALNLSALSGVRDDSLAQAQAPPAIAEDDVHLATFLVTDGDNVQWTLGGLPGYFDVPARGTLDLGWALPPCLADLAPSVVRWYFDHASQGAHRDRFVAGPSGDGYFYPSQYPPDALAAHVANLGPLLDRADLGVVQILDFHAFHRMDLWNAYFSQPNMEALFYLEYAPYSGAGGAVQFSTNGNPVIAAREMLWPGLEDGAQLVQRLNSHPRDPTSPDGYSLVPVLVWGASVAAVGEVVGNLAPQVRVVTPDVFARRVRDRVGRNLAYPFSAGLQGWAGFTSGKPYDKALWTASGGHPGGGMVLDGSDLGHPDNEPNAWFRRQVTLPLNCTDLSFDTMASNDGRLRVRLEDGRGVVATLLDWEGLPQPHVWVRRTASLRAYAGQTVTFVLEQNDGGQGAGEYRYVDNWVVGTAGAAVYRPAPPKIVSLACRDGVHVDWRDNDLGGLGFRVGRRDGTNGVWREIAVAATNATGFVDKTIEPGTTYEYRVRSWNVGGAGDSSQPRRIAVPARAKLTATAARGGLSLAWPASAVPATLFSSSTLGPGAVWTQVNRMSSIAGGSNTVLAPIGPPAGSNAFFQLR